MAGAYLDKSLKGRDFLTISDFTTDEIRLIIDAAHDLKKDLKEGIPHPVLQGKSMGMIFTKPSTRTRVSFEVGMYQLGGYALFLSAQDIQLRRGESLPDTARTLERYLDGIMIRTFDQADVDELAEYGSIPVINGLTDLVHPTQVIADLMTVEEHQGKLAGLKLAYIGDGNNVAHSLLQICAKMGVQMTIACPPGYEPDAKILAAARQDAVKTGVQLEVVEDPAEAAKDADAIYTDIWASMGQEKEQDQRIGDFQSYQVNEELLKRANPGAVVLHCLPAHRGEEITDQVMDGPQSVVFDEAENRLHAHKAIMALMMG
ncbi:MAG: ornithine carbamoyltransferase [Eubacteriales bacterium]|nr:ornithine carbamoyltransferase [Eubacteriales bacterium]MDD3074394.1 ornithine carbamoyltransferase [Eubacteriales bacterium]